MFNFSLYGIVTMIPAIIIAISFHEFAHAYVAYKMGDNTALQYGRMTLNPISHIDYLGFAMLLIGGFGWAKPVPINENNFKNRKVSVFLVSIAGIIMNIIIAIFSLAFLAYFGKNNISISDELFTIILNIAVINISFATFNLLPIPPLDGSKIILSIFSDKFRYNFYKYENYGFLIMVFLLVIDTIDFILNPVVNIIINSINFVLEKFI